MTQCADSEVIHARLPLRGGELASTGGHDAAAVARRLEQVFRRIGLDGDRAFYAVAAGFVEGDHLPIPTIRERGRGPLKRVLADPEGRVVMEALVQADPQGVTMPVIYQHFVGRRFRRGSGKFFTPASIAASMASFASITEGTVVMDPSCGGGTFLVEASRQADGPHAVTLLGNDVDATLADLTRLRLSLLSSHSFEVREESIFDDGALAEWAGQADVILANPPFSLRITLPGFVSPLFQAGYTSSDALFLDQAWDMLRPGGRLVCLLPQSIFANSDYASLRKLVSERWSLRASIGLPEGVFHLTADTATRAGIVVLDKLPCPAPADVVFAHCASVGVALNARGMAGDEDDLAALVADRQVREALGLGSAR